MHTPIRILLVDDSQYFLDATQEYLSMCETIQVVGTATGGEDALTQALQLQPDVILLDLNLGEKSGLELIPSFKKYIPPAKIIILTFMENDGYRVAADRAGADAFVQKTEVTQTLSLTISRVTGRPVSGQDEASQDGIESGSLPDR